MKNKKRNMYLLAGTAIVILAAVIAVIFVVNREKESPEAEAADIMTAMYVPIAEDIYILVGQENGVVFTATFPEELYDVQGNKITKEQLQRGNILKIYGNGIMAESYPGQYPGVSRMEVIEEGSPSDADEYQDIVNQVYQAPDPAEPPTLNVEYRTDTAAVTIMVDRGGYEWTYIDADGLSDAVIADSMHVLQWEKMNDARLDEPADLTLSFSKKPESVEAVRWSAELAGTEQDIPEGEEVKVEYKDETFIIPGAESGYIYEITGIWENGRAYYGFTTEANEKSGE